jgi:hypothetical protein
LKGSRQLPKSNWLPQVHHTMHCLKHGWCLDDFDVVSHFSGESSIAALLTFAFQSTTAATCWHYHFLQMRYNLSQLMPQLKSLGVWLDRSMSMSREVWTQWKAFTASLYENTFHNLLGLNVDSLVASTDDLVVFLAHQQKLKALELLNLCLDSTREHLTCGIWQNRLDKLSRLDEICLPLMPNEQRQAQSADI